MVISDVLAGGSGRAERDAPTPATSSGERRTQRVHWDAALVVISCLSQRADVFCSLDGALVFPSIVAHEEVEPLPSAMA